jgi:DNA-binding PadR family transcriptional regulator
MERKLLLLGLLRTHEMHGYQLNEILDRHLGASVHLTKPTAYRLLNEMTREGWITFNEERAGSRPTRRVYAVTAEGEAAFQRLLRESLASYQPATFQSDISLAFLDELPVDESAPLLRRRRATIAELLQRMDSDESHHGSFHLVIEHRVHHLSAELAWLDGVIARWGDNRQNDRGGHQE